MEMKYYVKCFSKHSCCTFIKQFRHLGFAKVSSNSRFCDSGVVTHFLLSFFFLFIILHYYSTVFILHEGARQL